MWVLAGFWVFGRVVMRKWMVQTEVGGRYVCRRIFAGCEGELLEKVRVWLGMEELPALDSFSTGS